MPFAYVLRDHEVFQRPFEIDKTTEAYPTPAGWTNIKSKTVDVVRLAPEPKVKRSSRRQRRERKPTHSRGWATYFHGQDTEPEVELLCGGINSKSAGAGAVWRQGNLMHFGFEQTPDELNENGRHLLVNSIAYIARFTEDRPILRTPSYLKTGNYYYSRQKIDRFLIIRTDSGPEKTSKLFFTPAVLRDARKPGELRAFYEKNREFLTPRRRGKLDIDQDAAEFGIGPARRDFLPALMDAMESGGERGELAGRLAERYAPDLAAQESLEDRKRWLNENQPFLFFSDLGGYRWYVDELRKGRNERLRRLFGDSRATHPPFEFIE